MANENKYLSSIVFEGSEYRLKDTEAREASIQKIEINEETGLRATQVNNTVTIDIADGTVFILDAGTAADLAVTDTPGYTVFVLDGGGASNI